MSTAIEFNNVSKQYKLGLVSTKTLSHDLNRWWQTKILHKEDPYLKIGSVNDRSAKADSDYVWALKDIDFKVEQGDVVGIIGKNGAGKSTLLKLLSRVTNPTTGTIRARGRIASLLEVGTGFHPELTGRENIYMNGSIMGMNKAEITRKLDEIVDFSGCERYIDTPVKRYSSGMTVRLGFAIAAHLDPEILVVDEVLAVGDAEFQKKAIGKMQDVSKGEGRTVLFVSHNMASMRALCKTGIVLDKGKVYYRGAIEDAINKYQRIDYTNSEIVNVTDIFKINNLDIKIDKFSINNDSCLDYSLEFPNRELNIIIEGSVEGKHFLDMEVMFSDATYHNLIAKSTPSLSTGKTIEVNNGRFKLNNVITLPKGMTNGEYEIDIDITHPKVQTYATTRQPIKLSLNGNYTSQGISIDRKYFGYFYL